MPVLLVVGQKEEKNIFLKIKPFYPMIVPVFLYVRRDVIKDSVKIKIKPFFFYLTFEKNLPIPE